MPAFRIALLDDYQDVARSFADWSRLPADAELQVYTDNVQELDALAARLKDVDCVMALRERAPFPRALLERLPRLKLICSAGMRNAAIDVEAATALGILVCGTTGRSRNTSEMTWALILGLLRHLPREHANVAGGQWQQTVGVELLGKTIGLVGLGKIGGEMAAVAHAFGMKVIAWSANLTDERAAECHATKVGLQDLLRTADIVSIHTRLSERTRGLLGAAELAQMRPEAYLINSSRGPIVDGTALLDVLQNHRIAGAGLDVFDQEPLPAAHPLRSLDNVVLTPHLGYVTRESYTNFYTHTLENILAYLAGKPTRVINEDVLGKLRPR